jgi:hypothetical protein
MNYEVEPDGQSRVGPPSGYQACIGSWRYVAEAEAAAEGLNDDLWLYCQWRHHEQQGREYENHEEPICYLQSPLNLLPEQDE